MEKRSAFYKGMYLKTEKLITPVTGFPSHFSTYIYCTNYLIEEL